MRNDAHLKQMGIQVGSVGFDRQAVADHAQQLANNIQGSLKRSLEALGVVSCTTSAKRSASKARTLLLGQHPEGGYLHRGIAFRKPQSCSCYQHRIFHPLLCYATSALGASCCAVLLADDAGSGTFFVGRPCTVVWGVLQCQLEERRSFNCGTLLVRRTSSSAPPNSLAATRSSTACLVVLMWAVRSPPRTSSSPQAPCLSCPQVRCGAG